jgi:VanZ family protein
MSLSIHESPLLPAARPVRLAARGLFAALLGVISFFALDPAPPQLADTGWDKANHALAFAALAAVWLVAWAVSRPRLWQPVAALMGYGLLIELLQAGIPGRSADVADLVGDAAGLALGLAVAAGLGHVLRRRQARRVRAAVLSASASR